MSEKRYKIGELVTITNMLERMIYCMDRTAKESSRNG